MSFLSRLVVGLIVVIQFGVLCHGADSPESLVAQSGLGKLIDREFIVVIVESDDSLASTAKTLADKLEAILEQGQSQSDLPREIEAQFLEVNKNLPPAARAAWLAAFDEMEEVINGEVSAAPDASKQAKQKELYRKVADGLKKLSTLQSEVDANPSAHIVRARFWLDAARMSGVYRYDQRPLESTKRLSQALMEISTQTSSTSDQLKASINMARNRFLNTIRSQRTTRQHAAWDNFIHRWVNELARADEDDAITYNNSNPHHLRKACAQAAEQLLNLGETIDSLHQQQANTGQVRLTGTSSAGDGAYGGASRAASLGSGRPRHVRVIGRIHRRHQRASGRIATRNQ